MSAPNRTRSTVGRLVELNAIRDMVTGLDDNDGPRGLFLLGPPGIGKTQLWSDGAELARAHGVHVRTTRPAQADVRVAFAALRDLIGNDTEELLCELPEPQRRALAVALLLEEPGTEGADSDVVSASFLSALRLLSRSRPLLLAIDDAQWLDVSSRSVLAFALRRLEEERVGLLATVRVQRGVDVDDLIGALPSDRTDRHDLAPLSVAELYELVRERRELSLARPTVLQLHELSGGNPFFALELARALPASDRLMVPVALSELLRTRLSAVSPATQDVLLAAAALARPTRETLEQIDSNADAALAEARAAEIVEEAFGDIRFTHPLLASVHYSEAPASARRAMHRRLGDADLDPEERARHLALAATGSDEKVAQALDGAVALARRRGTLASAAELADLAVTMTPQSDAAHHVRTISAADLLYWSGDPARGERLLVEALGNTDDAHVHAKLHAKLGEIAYEHDQTVSRNHFQFALAHAGDDDRLRVNALVWLAILTSSSDPDEWLRCSAEAVHVAERTSDRLLLAFALSVYAGTRYQVYGEVETAMHERAIALAAWNGDVGQDDGRSERGVASSEAVVEYAKILVDAWELDQAREMFEPLVVRGRAIGTSELADILEPLADLELNAGNLSRAAELATEAVAVAAQGGRLDVEMHATFRLGWVQGLLGDIDTARQLCERALYLANQCSGFFRGARLVLGYLESSLENYEAAWAFLDPANPLTGTMTPLRPVIPVPETVEVLVGLGRIDEARTLLEPFAARAEILQRPWAIARVAHCRGLVLAAEGELSGAEAAAMEAVALNSEHRWALHLGRSLLALGAVQRQLQRKAAARLTLERAVVVFEGVGARIWLERARKELHRIGGRSAPAGGELSATEARIAELVTTGKTNTEVAHTLHLSRKTVEWNLSKVYRKLGVRSRTELASRLTDATNTRDLPG